MATMTIPEWLIESASKGDVIETKDISDYLPPIDSAEERAFHVLKWAKLLERKLAEAGKPCTIRIRQHARSIAILTDSEASDFNRMAFRAFLHRAKIRHDHLMSVDRLALDDDQQIDHERAIRSQSAVLASIDQTDRQIRAIYHRRDLPIAGNHQPAQE